MFKYKFFNLLATAVFAVVPRSKDEVTVLTEKLAKEWESFKKENDKRLEELSQGKSNPLTEEKVDKHSAAIGEMQRKLDEISMKLNRPGVGAGDTEEAEHKQHRKLFASWVRKGVGGDELTSLQQKLLQIGVDGDGGFAVPEELDRTIGKMEIDAMPMEAEVSSFTMGGENYEKLMDLRGTSSGWVGEVDARPETNTPVLGSFKPVFGELYANPFATQKMLDDAFFNVEAWLAESIAEKFSQDLDLAILTGNGVNKPKGILAHSLAATADATRPYGTLEQLNSGTNGDFDTDDLLDLMTKLKPGYRQGAKWLMAMATLTKIRKFKDSTGQYLWQPSIQGGQPGLLLGYPVIEDENVPAIATGSKSVLFGNFKRAYKLINLKGIRVLRDPFTNKPKVGFYTTKRVGGGVEDSSAIKVLNLAT
jgi:HK97 family phage major capsid protein